MTDETPAQGALPAAVPAAVQTDIRAHLLQSLRKLAQADAEATRLQGQVFAQVDEIVKLKALLTRQGEEHEAALTDRDLAHSQHVDRLEADIARLHEAIRQQGAKPTPVTMLPTPPTPPVARVDCPPECAPRIITDKAAK